MDRYTYQYQPTVKEINIAILEYMYEEMQKSDTHSKSVYYMLSGMLNNASREEDFKEWHKRKFEYAIRNAVKF